MDKGSFISYILLLAMTLLWIVPDIRMEQIFEGDMFFDPDSDTSVCYGSLSLKHEFRLHTTRYELREHPGSLMFQVEYIMTDNSVEPGIHGFQEMTITKMEDFCHEESI